MDSSKPSPLTSLFVILTIVVLAVLIAAIGIGAYFLRDCPVQPYIPVYLIVFGVFFLLVVIVSLGLFYGLLAKDTFEMLLLSLLVISVSFVLYLFVVCWFITVIINMIAWMILITATGLGTSHFHECPVQPKLPVYMTVIGATGLLSLLLMYLRNTLDDCPLARFCTAFILMLCVFIVCWFIAGTYWVYSIYPPNNDSTRTGNHCHRTLYLFAFWFNNICFLCVSILFVFCLYTILYNCTVVVCTDRTAC